MVHRFVIWLRIRRTTPVMLCLGALVLVVAHRFAAPASDLVLFALAATTSLALVLWIVGGLKDILPGTSEGLLALLLLASAGGSVLLNDRVPWSNLILLGCHLALFWVGWGVGRQGEGLRQLGVGFMVCATLVAAYGVVQFYRWDPMPANVQFPDRVLSVFANPNHFANLMAASLPMALAGLLTTASRRVIVVGQLVCASLYAGLLMAGSRGAWIAGCAGVAVVAGGFLLHWRRGAIPLRPVVIISTLGLLAAVTLGVSRRPVMTRASGPVTVAQRALSTTRIVGPAAKRDATVNHRYFIWGVAARMIAAAPIAGHGYGDFANTFAAFRDDPGAATELGRLSWSQRRDPTAYAHNEFLHTWVETGLLGLTGLVGLIAVALTRSWRKLMRRCESLYYWGALGAFGVILIHSSVSYPLRLPLNGAVFWILLGIITGVGHGSEKTTGTRQ